MKIKTQLILLGITAIALMVAVGALSVFATRKVGVALEANAVLTTVLRNHSEADMMHDSLRGDVYEAVLAGTRGDTAQIVEVRKDFATHAANFKARIEANTKLNFDRAMQTRLKELRKPLEAYIDAAEELIAVAEDYEKAALQLKSFQQAFEALEKPMSKLSDQIEVLVRQRTDAVDEATHFAETLVFCVTLLGVLLMLLLGYVAFRGITAPIQSVQRAVGDFFGAGTVDLTAQLPSTKGEFNSLSSSINQFISSLHDIVSRVRDSATTISDSSQQVAQGNQSLSARTEAHASSLQQTAASMEQFTATIKQNADHAQRANELAKNASAVARRGGETVRGVVTTMQGISESSGKISDIIGVIDGIAFQTNILALNAAVEAARAGEQGRGFAVVASEVRALAQRSAQAAKEIKDLIRTSVEQVDGGTKFVADAGKAMEDIVASVKEVTDIMAGISTASLEQLAGVEQVNRAVLEMDVGTQQNAALVEESAASAQHMADQARELVIAVARFKLHASTLTTVEPREHATPTEPAHTTVTTVTTAPQSRVAALPPSTGAAAPPSGKATRHADGEWKEF